MELLKTYLYTGRFRDRLGLGQNENRYLLNIAMEIPHGFIGGVSILPMGVDGNLQIRIRIERLLVHNLSVGNGTGVEAMSVDGTQKISWQKEVSLTDDSDVIIEVLLGHETLNKLSPEMKRRLRLNPSINDVSTTFINTLSLIGEGARIEVLRQAIATTLQAIQNAEQNSAVQNTGSTRNALISAQNDIDNALAGTNTRQPGILPVINPPLVERDIRPNLDYVVSRMSKTVRGQGSDIIE